jgi:DNA polymerase-3 subunit beta
MKADKFVVSQKSLVSILTAMQPICTKRTVVDATASILFQINHKELILKSTDLEISLQYSCDILESNLTQNSSFLVNGKKIFELTKELEDQIEFQLNVNNIVINSGSVHLSLNIKDAQEFPPLPERIENMMQLKADDLLSMFEKVAFLIPQNNSNAALNGLLIEASREQLKLTATDGHCLAQVCNQQYHLDQAKTWLLPRRAVFELKKIIETGEDQEIFIGLCDNQLVFSGMSFNFFSKLLVDSFPEYQAIMSKSGFYKGAVKKDLLVRTLRRSACLLSGQFIATEFGFESNKLNVMMQNKEIGSLEETLELDEFTGSKLDIRFYAPYLLNGLQIFNDKQANISFYLSSRQQPIIFEHQQGQINFTYLAMPVSAVNQAQNE